MVTGGAGFIGSNLVDRLLAEGHTVDVVDTLVDGSLANLAEARALGAGRFHFHQVDVRSPDLTELIARRRPEVVYHLAAPACGAASVVDAVGDAEVNIIGTLRVLEGARRAESKKVVFASSGAIYGQAETVPTRESQAQQPLSPYGVAKKAVTDYLFVYRERHGLEFTSLALANVYGPRQSGAGGAGAVAIFASRLVAGEPCVIFGDGKQTRDFIYVDDAVDAFSRAGEKGSGLLCNVGTGRETTINDLYVLMASLSPEPALAPVHGPGRAGEPLRSCLDVTRASIHLGWKPWTDLRKGAAAVLDWYRERANAS